MGIHTYFRSLNELERIYRCPGKFKFEEHSVAEHSWKVVQYAKTLADIEERHGAQIDWKKLYEITSSHDYGEIFIGDIKTPVKHSSEELRNLILQVEEGMVHHFIEEHIPEEFKDIFRNQLREGKDDSVEGLILEVADKLDQVYEACRNAKREYGKRVRQNVPRSFDENQKHQAEMRRLFLKRNFNRHGERGGMSPIDIKRITKEALES
ncbi:hypothetical protein HMSSN036_11310 [Paenibacillus macerans]|nr:hypothetical protein HMSSN036_11310 [Paenibacillus macerans]